MSDLRTVQLHIERLRRHYDVVVGRYDEISLWDLSSSLRNWADMRADLPKLAPKFQSTVAFKTSTPSPKAFRAARGHRYVFAYLPGGVVTRAAEGLVAGIPAESGDFSLASVFRQSDGYAELKNFAFVSAKLPDATRNALRAEHTRGCNFHQWLTAECIRLAFNDPAGTYRVLQMNRDQLIRIMANTHDGSHPSISSDRPFNELEIPARHLMQFRMGHLPLPYFCLLKIAQDLLAIAPRLLPA